MEECEPCPVFASFTLAFALQLRKKHGKPRQGKKNLSQIKKNLSQSTVYITQSTVYIQHNAARPDGSVMSRKYYGGKSYNGHVTCVH